MTHLIILQNGLNGHHWKMSPISNYLNQHLKGNYKIVVSDVNNLYQTWDGLAKGGLRLAEFVRIQIIKYSATHLSFIGHSLGGLYIRYCIGILKSEGIFNQIRPQLYISIASPHFGCLDLSPLKRVLANHLIGLTGQELLCQDADQMLTQLSQSESQFMTGLAEFQKRIVYGNLEGDDSVAFDTSCICQPLYLSKEINKHQVVEIIPLFDCQNQFSNDRYEQMYIGLNQLKWLRKAINLKDYFNIHNAIANKGYTSQTHVLDDIVVNFNDTI